MYCSTHTLTAAHPVHTGWVDEALAAAHGAGDPLGALVGRPLGGGHGLILVGWPDEAAGRLELIDARSGSGTAPPRYMQVVIFDGPRTAEWAAAEERATARIWPAVRDTAGILWTLRLRGRDNAVTVVTLAESADALDNAVRAIMSTELLPDEDPALLSQPDRMALYYLMHADLRLP